MKITKISIQGFRAFDEEFVLDLEGGKSLLLYGENGSGKSSIYLALSRFMEEKGDNIALHRNRFARDERASEVRIHITGEDTAGTRIDQDFIWDATEHPLPIPANQDTARVSPALRSHLVDASRRAGFLDYRALIRTHLLARPLPRYSHGPTPYQGIYGADTTGLEEQLFDLVTLVILRSVRITVPGGRETTIGTLLRHVWATAPSTRHRWRLDPANSAANAFNAAFNAKLPELETAFGRLLGEFTSHQLEVKFQPVSIRWDKATLTLKGAELVPEIKFRGTVVPDFHRILNEARLSAIATCLFLAGVQLSDNDRDTPRYARLLVLDDALIGLEVQNRLPVLRILGGDAFRQYQVFLMTHDRVWFDLARDQLSEPARWVHRELLAHETDGKLIPQLRPSPHDLDRARGYLTAGDLRAAAHYARSAFETRLRNVCEDKGIEIKYKKDHKKITVDALWTGILARQSKREADPAYGHTLTDFIPLAMKTRVETMRSTVLNQLSHADPPNLVQAEVQDAINTVAALQVHPFT